jgi:phosphohistidine phosphatase
MRCYFLRHGIAAEAGEFHGSDFDRPLTDEGHERMVREAKTMAALSIELDVILTSPLVRAKQTAAIVAKELKIRDRLVEDTRLGLDFGPSRLASILKERGDAQAIMFVGHEPSMSTTVGQLIGSARIDFKKGALAFVNVPDPATARGELVWLVPPKVLARK